MLVRIKYIGVRDVEVPAELDLDRVRKVKDVVQYISELNEVVLKGVTVLVNKEKASFETELKEGDEILLLQVLGGG